MLSIKRWLLLLTILYGSLFFAAAQKEIFLRQIEFKLERISDIDYENEYFMTMKFSKGESYLFKIINHIDNYAGKAVLELLEADKLVLTNFLNDKYYDNLNFVCNKTGFYDILIRFKDNKVGNSAINIKLLQ
ncbi:MAG: hypothetical protein JW723_00190 [Bacteroidales bacterium]|nr:hypothetical protein [Bacteroidales bacterium]